MTKGHHFKCSYINLAVSKPGKPEGIEHYTCSNVNNVPMKVETLLFHPVHCDDFTIPLLGNVHITIDLLLYYQIITACVTFKNSKDTFKTRVCYLKNSRHSFNRLIVGNGVSINANAHCLQQCI